MAVYRDCPNFWLPPIISGTGEATNFKFCTRILSIDGNKTPLQISGKVVGCVVRTLKTFQCTMHILGASRGLLCDSSAVLFEDGHLSSKKKKKNNNNNNMNSNMESVYRVE